MSFFDLFFYFSLKNRGNDLKLGKDKPQVSIYKQKKQKKIYTESNKGLYSKTL